MTDISAISSTSTIRATSTKSTETTSSADQASLDYDAFLQLMIAQLENQDPTDPIDSTEYMAQLATFTQVEQSIATNTKLDALLTASSLEQANALIGRTATSADGETSGEVTSVTITSDGALATLEGGGTLLIEEGVTIS